jgi:choice-of-anchor A domain-containing protein
MKFHSYTIGLLISTSALAAAGPFGSAANYNVFTTGNFSSQYSDTEGKIAAGGSVNLSGYSVGLQNQGGLGLVAGKSLTFNGGTVYGTAKFGTTASISNATINNQVSAGGSNPGATQGSPVDFTGIGSFLAKSSTYWNGLAENGTVTNYYGQIHLDGGSGLQVFDLTATQLQNATEVDLHVSSGATVLINVSGSSVAFQNYGYNFTGADSSHVLWNLSTASTATVSSLSGSVLAMGADITTSYGAINGQVLAKSISGSSQINWHQFTGTLPPAPVPEPTTIAALGLGMLGLLRRRRA